MQEARTRFSRHLEGADAAKQGSVGEVGAGSVGECVENELEQDDLGASLPG